MATRLIKLEIQNVAAVGNPANKRKFLIVKNADAERTNERLAKAMTPQEMDEIFRENPAAYDEWRAQSHRGGASAMAKADIEGIIARRVGQLLVKAKRGTTFEQALAAIFKADPALHEQWRRSTYA